MYEMINANQKVLNILAGQYTDNWWTDRHKLFFQGGWNPNQLYSRILFWCIARGRKSF